MMCIAIVQNANSSVVGGITLISNLLTECQEEAAIIRVRQLDPSVRGIDNIQIAIAVCGGTANSRAKHWLLCQAPSSCRRSATTGHAGIERKYGYPKKTERI